MQTAMQTRVDNVCQTRINVPRTSGSSGTGSNLWPRKQQRYIHCDASHARTLTHSLTHCCVYMWEAGMRQEQAA